MSFYFFIFQEPSVPSVSTGREAPSSEQHNEVNDIHEAVGEAYDEPRDNEYGDDNDDEGIQRVTLIAGYGHRDRGHQRHHYNEPGLSGWRISPIPWRMMLSDEANYSEPGPSHSNSHQPSSQDFRKQDQFNKRQYEAIRDHEPDTDASYKRFKASPPHLDDIDRKISLAGKYKHFKVLMPAVAGAV